MFYRNKIDLKTRPIPFPQASGTILVNVDFLILQFIPTTLPKQINTKEIVNMSRYAWRWRGFSQNDV